LTNPDHSDCSSTSQKWWLRPLRVTLPWLGLGGERKLAAEQLVVGISRDELLQGKEDTSSQNKQSKWERKRSKE